MHSVSLNASVLLNGHLLRITAAYAQTYTRQVHITDNVVALYNNKYCISRVLLYSITIPQPLMGINFHGNRGHSFTSWLIPVLIPTFYLILVPLSLDYHGTPNAIGIPNPMHISTTKLYVHYFTSSLRLT